MAEYLVSQENGNKCGVRIAQAQMGVSGDDSWGAKVHPEYLLDVTGRKNGRGAYLCFSKECLQKAIKNKGLERSLKMQIPQEVYENLERELDTIEL